MSNDDQLVVGEFIRTTPGGPIYRVEMVSEARARCAAVNPRDVKEGEWDDEKSGRVINISPNSLVIRVNKTAILKEAEDRYRRHEMSNNTVGIPVAEVSVKERRAAMAKKVTKSVKPNGKGALAGAAKAASERAAKTPKAPKTVRDCMCGCGEETTGYFAPGHDARFKGWMIKVERGTMDVNELPKAVQKAFDWKKTKTGMVALTNYKGDKHSGYDSKA